MTCDTGLPSLLRELESRARRGGGGGGGATAEDKPPDSILLCEEVRRPDGGGFDLEVEEGDDKESGGRECPGIARVSTSLSMDLEEGGGMLRRLRSGIEEAKERVDRPGLGGCELSVLSESREDMVRRLPLVLDCVDLDRRIWLCRRLRGGVGGRLCWEC